MTTSATPTRMLSLPLRIGLAPLVWLERARGRKRTALLLLYAVVAAIVGLLAWRAVSLNGLPDIGESFDVAAFEAGDVPESENAFALYRPAIAKLKPTPTLSDFNGMWGVVRGGWSKAYPSVKDGLAANREALGLWRRGTERPKGQAQPLRTIAQDGTKDQQLGNDMLMLAELALLEGSRLEEGGDTAGAWGWYNAALRSSRHLGMRGTGQWRVMGMILFNLAAERVTPWSNNPETDARLLHRAIADLEWFESATSPASESIRVDYLAFRNALRDPGRMLATGGGDQDLILSREQPRLFRAYLFLRREPERSLRVARLLTANRLAHCDEPPSMRPKRVDEVRLGNTGYPTEVFVDPGLPTTPEALTGWILSSFFAAHFLPNFRFTLDACDGERSSRETILMTLAERCYEREHGRSPPSNGVLVGPYLKHLPERYADPAEGIESKGEPRP